MNRKYLLHKLSNKTVIFIAVFIAVVLSIRFLDALIAVKVYRFLLSFRTLHDITENIPDLLLIFVAVVTAVMWVIYFYRVHKKKIDTETLFLRLAATTLPAIYILKSFLQFVFGRTSPRHWLISRMPLEFNWFRASGSCFPSGHMSVITALGAAVWIYYPKYRKPVLIMLILLGSSLIITDYHFLSDVIAGTYLGYIFTYFLHFSFVKLSAKNNPAD